MSTPFGSKLRTGLNKIIDIQILDSIANLRFSHMQQGNNIHFCNPHTTTQPEKQVQATCQSDFLWCQLQRHEEHQHKHMCINGECYLVIFSIENLVYLPIIYMWG